MSRARLAAAGYIIIFQIFEHLYFFVLYSMIVFLSQHDDRTWGAPRWPVPLIEGIKFTAGIVVSFVFTAPQRQTDSTTNSPLCRLSMSPKESLHYCFSITIVLGVHCSTASPKYRSRMLTCCQSRFMDTEQM